MNFQAKCPECCPECEFCFSWEMAKTIFRFWKEFVQIQIRRLNPFLRRLSPIFRSLSPFFRSLTFLHWFQNCKTILGKYFSSAKQFFKLPEQFSQNNFGIVKTILKNTSLPNFGKIGFDSRGSESTQIMDQRFIQYENLCITSVISPGNHTVGKQVVLQICQFVRESQHSTFLERPPPQWVFIFSRRNHCVFIFVFGRDPQFVRSTCHRLKKA